jgi:hypothetical protein
MGKGIDAEKLLNSSTALANNREFQLLQYQLFNAINSVI